MHLHACGCFHFPKTEKEHTHGAENGQILKDLRRTLYKDVNVSNLMRIYRKFFDFWTQKGQRNSKMKPRIFYVFACLNME